MGVLIIAEAPPSTSTYDKWKCYRATSKDGSYTVINGGTGQAITDLTYYDLDGTSTHWYKISYYDTANTKESAYSDALKALAETYTTVKKVEALLGISALTDSTIPTVQQVVEMVNRAEDEIDYRTGHAWRTRYNGSTSGQDNTAQYEYQDICFPYEYGVGIPIYLKHKHIKQFDATEGDLIEVWNGSSWEDWLGTKTEGRGDDYWCDYEKGIFYLRAYFFTEKPMGIRFKYRYGENVVDKTIEDIATKMVAMNMLMRDDRSVLLPTGTDNISFSEKIRFWQEQIDNKISGFKEFQIMSSVW